MGEIVRQEDEIVYRQEDGEVTAWLTNFEEKMELAHEGSPTFKKIFYLLVFAGVIYLVGIFAFF
jgi:hypothetical protein